MQQIKTISHLCCTTPRISTKSNKIDKNLVPWLSKISFFFFLLAKYSQRAIKANAYFIHKTISVRDKTAQIHTTQRKVIFIRTAENGRPTVARLYRATVRIFCMWSPHIGAYTTSLGVVHVQHKWLMVWCVQWYDISHSVKVRHSIQLGFASLNIEHQSFTSCEISYHCTINH